MMAYYRAHSTPKQRPKRSLGYEFKVGGRTEKLPAGKCFTFSTHYAAKFFGFSKHNLCVGAAVKEKLNAIITRLRPFKDEPVY